MTEEKFLDTLTDDLVLVDFYADWCGPCRMLSPILEEVAKEKNINVVKINVDDNASVAKKYGVMSIPTLIMFKNKNEVKKNIGFINKEELIKFIED